MRVRGSDADDAGDGAEVLSQDSEVEKRHPLLVSGDADQDKNKGGLKRNAFLGFKGEAKVYY